jgi:signal transduction histidine kinase
MVLTNANDSVIYSNLAARQAFLGGRALEGLSFSVLLRAAPEPLQQAVGAETDTLFTVDADGESEIYHLSQRRFLLNNQAHRLYLLKQLTRELSRQEVQTWKKVIRVIAHELNNSLAPIKSIAGSLMSILRRDPPPDDWREDMQRGLSVITSRSESLSRFIGAYARLAKLPRPQLQPLEVSACVGRAVSFETRLAVEVRPGPEMMVRGDPDQLEQVLINLLRNAADASLATNGKVRIGRHRDGSMLEIWVQDEGPGLSGTANLFVPFFTTKPGGSGIGLVLSRQIAEGHGGALMLENRTDGPGCVARLRLPG